jgi:hypothetical protein
MCNARGTEAAELDNGATGDQRELEAIDAIGGRDRDVGDGFGKRSVAATPTSQFVGSVQRAGNGSAPIQVNVAMCLNSSKLCPHKYPAGTKAFRSIIRVFVAYFCHILAPMLDLSPVRRRPIRARATTSCAL